jgi:hypothetical protein
MVPEELRQTLRQQPFVPFRLILTDGVGYDIRHPDLMMVGKHSAMVGFTSNPGQTFYERSVKVDLAHISRLEPLEAIPPSGSNGTT